MNKSIFIPILGITLALYNAALGAIIESANHFYGVSLPFLSAAIYYGINTCLNAIPPYNFNF